MPCAGRRAVSDGSELRDVVESVVGAFRRHGVLYYITGSLASSVHGEFRATNDLDVVALLERRHLGPLVTDLSVDFFADLEQAESALDGGTSFNLLHRVTLLKVDVFPCSSAFDREAMGRAIDVAVAGMRGPLRVISKEDILLAKLRWYRLGHETSERQRRDIEALAALNRHAFDYAYLSRWAEELGVQDLLRRCLPPSSS